MDLVPLCASILSLALDRWATTVNQLQVQKMRPIVTLTMPLCSTLFNPRFKRFGICEIFSPPSEAQLQQFMPSMGLSPL